MNTHRARLWLPALAALLVIGPALAQEKKDATLPRRDLDLRIHQSLREVIEFGATIYNAGDESGCLRLYQGALAVTVPLLDHRPELKKTAETKITRATNLPSVVDRAFALREVMDDIRNTIRRDTPALRPKSLWDHLGGEAVIRAVVKDFVAGAQADPKVNYSRGGKYKIAAPQLEQKLVELISWGTNGPFKYTGERNMREVHAGMKITDAEFDALMGHLTAALKKHNVPQAEMQELVTLFQSTKPIIAEANRPLWDRLGGDAYVREIAHAFVAAAAADPKVNFDRGGKYKPDLKNLEKVLVEQISSITGGPLKYSGRDMKTAHTGMKITEAEFNALAGHLVAALKKYKVPQPYIDELMGKIAETKKDIVGK